MTALKNELMEISEDKSKLLAHVVYNFVRERTSASPPLFPVKQKTITRGMEK